MTDNPESDAPAHDTLESAVRRLSVHHRTVYRYKKPVAFGEHRLMFRPRDSHDLRLVSTALEISPSARVRWHHDVFSNSIAIASFETVASELEFVSGIVVDHYGGDDPDFPVERFARRLPVAYSPEEIPDLGRTIERHYSDPDRKLDAWARNFLRRNGPTRTNDLLVRVNGAIKEQFAYEARDLPGVQTPVETLALGRGSCRDFAVLLMETARSFGLAARFVTGYLYDGSIDDAFIDDAVSEIVGAGATHAWVEIYLPGAGWVEFDPTNAAVGPRNLIRVAVARTPAQAMPVQGTFIGEPGDFESMSVEVTVTASTFAMNLAAS